MTEVGFDDTNRRLYAAKGYPQFSDTIYGDLKYGMRQRCTGKVQSWPCFSPASASSRRGD